MGDGDPIESPAFSDSNVQGGESSLRLVVIVGVCVPLSVIEGSWTGSRAALKARGASVTGSMADPLISESLRLRGG